MKNSSQHQQKTNTLSLQSLSTFQKCYFSLTHQLLKCLKVNKISFSILLLIETIQIAYFLLRDPTYWNSQVIKYIGLGMGYISVDYLVKQMPSIFLILLAVITGILLLTLIFMIFISKQTYQRLSKVSPFTKIIISITSWLLLIQKNILQIPCLWIIGVSFIRGIQVNLKIVDQKDGTNPIIISLGIVCFLLFCLLQFYISTSFCDCNPFSDIQFTGQSTLKCLIRLFTKAMLILYILLDNNALHQKQFIICFTIYNIFLAIYYHCQIGYHKQIIRILSLRLHYLIIWLSLCSMIALFSQNQAITTLTYLILLYLLLLFVLQFIEDQILQKNTIQKKSMFLKSDNQIENHVLELIKLVDTMEKRNSKIVLEGFLSYHHRLCKLNDVQCKCHKLMIINQREKIQEKSQFFHFLVDILLQGIARFPDSKRIYLLLTFIYQYRQKNRFRAIYSITKTLKGMSFFDKLYFYHQIHLIEQQMKQDDNKQNINKTVDINKFFTFNNLIVDFQKVIQFCVNQYIDFWKQLLEININIKRLQQCGSTITCRKQQVKNSFDQLMVLNPNNVHCLIIYGNFLLQVTNDQNNYQKYFDKSDNIMKNLKESSKIDQSGNKYTQNAQTIIIVISGNQNQLGTIVHTNNFIQKALSYKRSQLVSQNVASIMPKVFGEYHNKTLGRYLSTSAQRFNGKQRIVPALRKDGYMLPAVAMTKAIPDLTNGIQIVGFINALQQKVDQQEVDVDHAYILYRTDNQIIMGVSRNCYTNFGIPNCLVYGNPNNSMNQLKINHLFGTSFQKDPTLSSNLTSGEISITINTTNLSDDFIITRQSAEQLNLQNQDQQQERRRTRGVKSQVNIRTCLSQVYHGIPLRLISFYDVTEKEMIQRSFNSLSVADKQPTNQPHLLSARSQNQDMKDLKDFKNFISIKSQPSAIRTIRLACVIKILTILLSSVGMIIISFLLNKLHLQAVDVVQKGLIHSLILPQLLYQLQKPIQNRITAIKPTKLFDQNKFYNQIDSMIQMAIQNQNSILPLRYLINKDFHVNVQMFQFFETNTFVTQEVQYDQAINFYLSKYSILKEPANLNLILASQKNPSQQMYHQVKYDTIFTILEKSKEINNDIIQVYNTRVQFLSHFIYLVSGVMLLTVVIWLIFSIPHALSVTKINNRVLSLFSLISQGQVYGIIIKCIIFMKSYLTQAVILDDQQQFVQRKFIVDKQQNFNTKSFNGNTMKGTLKLQQNGEKMLLPENSPSQIVKSKNNPSLLSSFIPSKKQSLNQSMNLNNSMLLQSPHQTSSMMMINRNQSQYSQRNSVGGKKKLNKTQIKQKFDKMVNSDSKDRQKVVCRYVILAIVVLGFALFAHFFTYQSIFIVQGQLQIKNTLGQRAIAFRQLKTMLQQYLMDINSNITFNGSSTQQINYNKINQSYTIQRKLIQYQYSSAYSDLLFYYNTNNLCQKINDFSEFSLKNVTFSKDQCLSVGQGILTKGVKTTIVKILEQTRSILSINQKSLDRKAQLLNIIKYQILQKYLQNSMLHILKIIKIDINQKQTTHIIIIISVSTVFALGMIIFWMLFWKTYIEELNMQIWRTKGMLNIIPMRIITNNEVLKNQFASGHLQEAVR